MAESTKHVYDESKIKTLSSLEHIRLRTGMYIGRIGDGSHYDDGCYILLEEDVTAVVVVGTVADAPDVHAGPEPDVLQRRQRLDLALVVNVLGAFSHSGR